MVSFEKQILNNIEKLYKVKLIRQFPIIGYFLDGYDKTNNIVYEVNEEHHFDIDGNYNTKHIQRKNDIVEHLKCEWVDIDVPSWNKLSYKSWVGGNTDVLDRFIDGRAK